MARKRMLHPEFFSSEDVAAVPMPARLTFAGLWVYCDDSGRGKDVPALVKATVWPLDDEVTRHDVEAHLAALAARGLVCRYAVEEQPLVHVITWTEHQKISHPTPSKLPPCATHEDNGKGAEEDARRSGASPEDRGETLPSSVQCSEVQSSSSVGSSAAAASLQELSSACGRAGLVVSWKLTPAEAAEVVDLVATRGVRALVEHAKRRHNPNDPAHSVKAWLADWRTLPALRLVEKPVDCGLHPSAGRRPDGECGACWTDRRVADEVTG